MQKTDAQRRLEWLLIMAEEGIDTSDSPPLSDEAWKNAKPNHFAGKLPPPGTPHIPLTTFSVSLMPDAAAFYKSLGRKASETMETVLAEYAEAHKNTRET